MGVWIRTVGGEVVTDREIYDLIMLAKSSCPNEFMSAMHKFFNHMNYTCISIEKFYPRTMDDIASDFDNILDGETVRLRHKEEILEFLENEKSSLPLTHSLLIKWYCYCLEKYDDPWLPDSLYDMVMESLFIETEDQQESFPHWMNELPDYDTWDEENYVMGSLVSIHEPKIVVLNDTEECKNHSFSHSYSYYNIIREQISFSFLGVPPKIVWKYFDNFSNNDISLLINGSDCEGMISISVARRISQSLNDENNVQAFRNYVQEHFPDKAQQDIESYLELARVFKCAEDNNLLVCFG